MSIENPAGGPEKATKSYEQDRREIERVIRRSRWALLWEVLWRGLWPPLAVAGSFLVISFFGLWLVLPTFLHVIGLVVFCAGLIFAFWRSGRAVVWPTRGQAARRVEVASGLHHHPLSVLEDRPISGGDDDALRLWGVHRERAWKVLEGARAGWPSPQVVRVDPFALRALLGLLLVVSVVIAGDTWRVRLSHAVAPMGGVLPTATLRVDAWVAPPAYTGLAPVFLASGSALHGDLAPDDPLAVLVGSELFVRAQGLDAMPDLYVVSGAEEEGIVTPFTKNDSGLFEVTRALERTGVAAIRDNRGQPIAAWVFNVLADRQPNIEFSKPLSMTRNQSLAISFAYQDDYGVVSAKAVIAPRFLAGAVSGGTVDGNVSSALEMSLPLAQPRSTQADQVVYRDLTQHPWAGLPVSVSLVALDGANQTGRSATVDFILPERGFRHPLAQAIVAERRKLAADIRSREDVTDNLEVLAEGPAQDFGDTGIYLALRAVHARLTHWREGLPIVPVLELMWDIALAIDDDRAPLALRDLRAAEEALSEALARGEPEEEIDQLMAHLRAAVDAYLQALVGQQGETELPSWAEGLSERIDGDDVGSLLDTLEELVRTGAYEAARDLLAGLQGMFENLRPMSGPAEMTEGEAALSEAVEELSELIGAQRRLMDKTLRRAQKGQPQEGGPMETDIQALLDAQQNLQKRLDSVAQGLDENTGDHQAFDLRHAQRSMGGAVSDLEAQETELAARDQARAVDQLKTAAESLAAKLMEAMSDRLGGTMLGRAGSRDPLGRQRPGLLPGVGSSVELPDEMSAQRAREILDELRRRAGESGRPAGERGYLERLLERF